MLLKISVWENVNKKQELGEITCSKEGLSCVDMKTIYFEQFSIFEALRNILKNTFRSLRFQLESIYWKNKQCLVSVLFISLFWYFNFSNFSIENSTCFNVIKIKIRQLRPRVFGCCLTFIGYSGSGLTDGAGYEHARLYDVWRG